MSHIQSGTDWCTTKELAWMVGLCAIIAPGPRGSIFAAIAVRAAALETAFDCFRMSELLPAHQSAVRGAWQRPVILEHVTTAADIVTDQHVCQ
jgi:hypothetical protein